MSYLHYCNASTRRGEITRAFTVAMFLILLNAAMTHAQEPVQKHPDDGQMVVWRIDQPDVTKARTTYPSVTFKKYDEVIVRGGGCLDTGGIIPRINRTWKRYVNPTGRDTDRLYHGRISVPGATAGLVRISSIEGQHLVVNKFPVHDDGSAAVLQLGYEDEPDRYGDNKYDSKHDDGTQKQCALANDPDVKDGKAWLEITIKHHDNPFAVSPRNPIPRAPLDLWWEAVDENYLPLNPDWWTHQHTDANASPPEPRHPNSNEKKGCDRFREKGGMLVNGMSRQCTTWDPDVDKANIKSLFCYLASLPSSAIKGHANWAAVTYKGQIYFDVANNGLNNGGLLEGHGPIEDGDYDWLLVTEEDRGLSTGSVEDSKRAVDKDRLPKGVNALGMEFSSRETIDQFGETGWWHDFRKKVDGNTDDARKLVWGKDAIVIGLIGFDNEHGAYATGARVELHPVWGLAIRDDNNKDEVIWAIFARNWGNEGSCSNGWDKTGSNWQHYLPLRENKMTFFLPGALTDSSVVTPMFPPANPDGSPRYELKRMPDGILLTIDLGEPEAKKLFWGELHIRK